MPAIHKQAECFPLQHGRAGYGESVTVLMCLLYQTDSLLQRVFPLTKSCSSILEAQQRLAVRRQHHSVPHAKWQ